jgi:anaerobic selenocysteine-containing dehydrogenase
LVEVADGQAVRLAGNPAHPFTRGTLCTKVSAYLERVYHPQRILRPLKRNGPKGSGQFVPVSWEEFLDDLSKRWQTIIAESGAEAILPYSSAGNQGMIQMASLDRRLFAYLGCSRLERNICGEVSGIGLATTNGLGYGVDPEDLIHSRLIVLWGTNTIVTNMHLWPIITAARRQGAQVIVIDPIRTRTAEQADWHLQLRPASDAAFALGVMHILIRDQLIDIDYIDRYAEGFDALAKRVLDYPPEVVAELTGLSVTEIERFARIYGTTQPSLLRPLIGPEHHVNGAMIFRTIACLPILTGAWRHRGGGLARSTGALQYSVLNNAALTREDCENRETRLLNMRDLGSLLCRTDLTPPIRSLCIWNSNPAVSIPDQAQIRRGLAREDLFTVVHDLFMTETARWADYVLPATSQIEHLDLMPAWGHHYLALNRPAIPPRGEAVANTEFFRRIARAMQLEPNWLYDSDEQLVRTALNSPHPWLSGITFERLWEEGFARLNQPLDWRPYATGFPTTSGKAQLWSSWLETQGLDPLPHAGEIRRPSPQQLQLISSKTLNFLNASYCYSQRHTQREGQLIIHLHAHDAAARHLSPGDPVAVFNSSGRLTAECCVSDKVTPGVAWMPFGGWGDLSGNDVAVNCLTPTAPTDWGGGSGFYDTFVQVEKFSNSKS